ncbi:hypothetical protein [Enterobacter ludwigii]|uniref:hypothetical protein n=1 Tax=Enterobacter ludwigii TaxID=299767 RepID=UPI003EF8DB4F
MIQVEFERLRDLVLKDRVNPTLTENRITTVRFAPDAITAGGENAAMTGSSG